jgi:Domain of unknown function (DUF4157)
MHEHDHEHEGPGSLRPKAARLEEPDALAVRAALSGRLDAAGPRGVLGLQRAVGNAGATAALEEERSPVHDVVAAPGTPLDRDVREDMEARLGHDFSDVRVHTDGVADASAKAVNANAYTVGSHIAFQRSVYDPGSQTGRTTLAHELTHVVQQRNGPVDGTPSAGGVSISHPSDRFEREAAATAERAMAGPAPVQTAAAGPAPAVQREEAAEEEEPVQGSFVQREEAAEEEEPVQGSFVQREEEAPEEEQA